MELQERLLGRIRGDEGPEVEVPITIEDRIRARIEPLAADRDQLVSERTRLIAEREKVEADIGLIDKVLRAAGHDPTKKEKQRHSPPRAPKGALNETALRVLRVVAETEKPLTVKDVHAILAQSEVQVADSQVQKYLKEGRDRGIIATAGMQPSPSGGRESILYAPFDDTAEKLRLAAKGD